jgi:hypothetical protein
MPIFREIEKVGLEKGLFCNQSSVLADCSIAKIKNFIVSRENSKWWLYSRWRRFFGNKL